jgi:hypothetical protein
MKPADPRSDQDQSATNESQPETPRARKRYEAPAICSVATMDPVTLGTRARQLPGMGC